MITDNSPLANRDFVRLLVVVCGAFGNFALLLSVVPLWAASGGATEFGAGLPTGVLMAATVCTQLVTPRVLARWGYRGPLAFSVLVLGLSAPATALTPNVGFLAGIGLARGTAFGLLTVTGSVLVARLVPAARRGQGIGLYGIAVGLPNLTCLSAGVWAATRFGFRPVFLAGGVLALVTVLFLPRTRRAVRAGQDQGGPDQQGAGPEPAGGVRRGLARLARAGLGRPWAVLLGAAILGGGFQTFMALALDGARVGAVDAAPLALFVFSAAMLTARWAVGLVGDRRGPGTSLLPGAVTTLAGALGCILATAAAAGADPGGSPPAVVAWALAGALLTGAGFGALQNDSLSLMFRRSDASDHDTTSAAWNIALDLGTGAGAMVLGLVATSLGYPWAFGVAAVLVAGCVPIAGRETLRARHLI